MINDYLAFSFTHTCFICGIFFNNTEEKWLLYEIRGNNADYDDVFVWTFFAN